MRISNVRPRGPAVPWASRVTVKGQSRFSRFLSRNDRGEFVRSPEAFRALARPHFAHVESRLHGDTWRMPSALVSLVLSEPIQAAP